MFYNWFRPDFIDLISSDGICNFKEALKTYDSKFTSFYIGKGLLYMEKPWNSKTVYW